MAKSKINFEIEQEILANAKAYIAQHGGSLNKLVSVFFSNLGKQERSNAPLINPETRVLMDVSAGRITLMEGVRMLGLQNAGFLLQKLREAALPLPQLSAMDASAQADAGATACADCMLAPAADRKPHKRKHVTPSRNDAAAHRRLGPPVFVSGRRFARLADPFSLGHHRCDQTANVRLGIAAWMHHRGDTFAEFLQSARRFDHALPRPSGSLPCLA